MQELEKRVLKLERRLDFIEKRNELNHSYDSESISWEVYFKGINDLVLLYKEEL